MMLKEKINQIGIFIFALCCSLMFTQCSKDEFTGHSVVSPNNITATLVWDEEEPPTSLIEENKSFPFTIVLSGPQVADASFYISILDGTTATASEDYEFTDPDGNVISNLYIPAYETEVKGVLHIFDDIYPEEDPEILSFQIGDNRLSNMEFIPEVTTINMGNRTSEDITLTFDWERPINITIGGAEYEGVGTCINGVNIDVVLLDAAGNDLGDYQAATSECLEIFKMSSTTWTHGDGTFYLAAWLWRLGDIVPDPGTGTIAFPIESTLIQTGVFVAKHVQDEADAINTDTAPDWTVPPSPIFRVEVSGGKFSFYDYITGELVAAQ